jgi:hypothetical protein
MLTHEERLEVAAWKDRVGERRPGFLHDHASNLHGPVSACHSVPTSTSSAQSAGPTDLVEMTLGFERDPDTGETRLVWR